MTSNKIKKYIDEDWKDLLLDNMSEKSKYKISNFGRIISYINKPEGVLLKLSDIHGYKSFNFKDKSGKVKSQYAHRLVAKFFLEEPKEGQIIVVHKDNQRHNNCHTNLLWASESESFHHNLKFDRGFYKNQKYRAWSKLTESQVKIIKKKLADPKRKTKMKVLARQFGVSTMQISRIKSGENWGTVTID
jgi:NUMOD4 motif